MLGWEDFIVIQALVQRAVYCDIAKQLRGPLTHPLRSWSRLHRESFDYLDGRRKTTVGLV